MSFGEILVIVGIGVFVVFCMIGIGRAGHQAGQLVDGIAQHFLKK